MDIKEKADVGVIGLAVMGQNLALNFADNNCMVSVYNRSTEKTRAFIDNNPSANLSAHEDLESFVNSLKTPRKIILMVKAGSVVDQYGTLLKPLLNDGDILIDGGNSLASDTKRRVKEYSEGSNSIFWVGAGISGGELGARFGPAVMLGGNPQGAKAALELFTLVAAKDFLGGRCCHWFGENGMGHFVKTVHNGIEYGDMQLICEVFDFMKRVLVMDYEEIAKVFDRWSQGDLGSYLIEITRDILRYKDDEGCVLDRIKDRAGQKGTGRWTCESALSLGAGVGVIHSAVEARVLSSQYDLRQKLASIFKENNSLNCNDSTQNALFSSKEEIINALERALWASRLMSYAQGLSLLKAYHHSDGSSYNLSLSDVARVWSGGCIIRSQLLKSIHSAYQETPMMENLLVSPLIKTEIEKALNPWRKIAALAQLKAVATPALSSALNYFYSMTQSQSPANLLQAQRDYFGAHTYERLDKPEGEFYHTDWNSTGGVSSASYNA